MTKIKLKLHQRTCVEISLKEDLGTFCYPTGTGKTLAEAHVIAEHIKLGDTGIYVVLAPRIMLAHQLFEELWSQLVIGEGINPVFFSLHSGKSPKLSAMAKKNLSREAQAELQDQDGNEDAVLLGKLLGAELKLTPKQCAEAFESSTRVKDLREAAERASNQGRPLIIVSTYHSAERLITAFQETDDFEGREISVLIADEGHNAVAVGFTHIHDIPASKRFYFTATLKNTDGGEDGLGMQNDELFGVILDSLSPAEAVTRGLIVRPRIHYIELSDVVTDETAMDADFKAIEAAFLGHSKAVGGIGAKLLVAAKGTLEIRQILEHSECFKRLQAVRPGLKVFDISSAYGARINGSKPMDRAEFLAQLQGMSDKDEAIILHYDILSEGIDVPGITGVMPLRSLGTAKFLQTLGRATRLHKTDRVRLSDERTASAEAAKLDWFVKPCAWLVLPCFGAFGQEIRASAETYVRQLRTFGWVPGEGDLLTEAAGENEPEPIDEVHPEDKKLPKLVDFVGEVSQRFEDRKLMEEAYKEARELSTEELV